MPVHQRKKHFLLKYKWIHLYSKLGKLNPITNISRLKSYLHYTYFFQQGKFFLFLKILEKFCSVNNLKGVLKKLRVKRTHCVIQYYFKGLIVLSFNSLEQRRDLVCWTGNIMQVCQIRCSLSILFLFLMLLMPIRIYKIINGKICNVRVRVWRIRAQ